MAKISGSRILIMATDGFEESELFGPLEILTERGARVMLASPDLKPIQATVHDDPGKTIRPDMQISDARAQDFDALLLPGGVRNPDALRTNKSAIALIRDFASADKPVAAICHGPWLLIEAGLVKGRTVTGWKSIWTDLANAGGEVVDRAVALDGNLITSRKPDDVEAFTDAFADAIARSEAKASA
ncbi:MAG TPA: type 1 glutamine amidotransferase domain-containing protein [Sphingomicrobium sp.]|nr:type 1 glutamine amidotransferase domain-containing protein [Sphingomicrobium sp.]